MLIVASFLPANHRRPDIGILKANVKRQLDSSRTEEQWGSAVQGWERIGRDWGESWVRRKTQEAVWEKDSGWGMRSMGLRGSCNVSETVEPSSAPMDKGSLGDTYTLDWWAFYCFSWGELLVISHSLRAYICFQWLPYVLPFSPPSGTTAQVACPHHTKLHATSEMHLVSQFPPLVSYMTPSHFYS